MDFKSSPKKRMMFTKEEDDMIKELVTEFEKKPNWKQIGEKLGRTARQCRERFKTYLAPNTKNTAWTPEEDELLKKLVHQFGNHWAQFRVYFPGKSDNNIKNRYNFHIQPIRKSKYQNVSLDEPVLEVTQDVLDTPFDMPAESIFEWNLMNDETYELFSAE
ncbi:Myb-like DNA-binding domain containing protein [Trichomonas vaginalis G3]|uniref:Myb-like DNA-binding domain containing protein n=1 Tax=Trichomonas vaginalis (strain ATCC PRA-98 / G3) TaxID=412133 RepID=A2FH34_TRIV3|nr:RNA polymerase II transcription regulator recruiting protein [Trichomonas vaginalis G3]EAX95802.1 Myb-like DNA-binding domain containing protein [Trichomonas vaginalis G3]KAI5536529.1 RNA polymerase II transcription regulator recruiting protein [Trichomonas vaginalis G3]|eukprot:XP_001308732.1 Myb-like DNA-binding domain containing protein [Trichomonas vaginalis G3]